MKGIIVYGASGHAKVLLDTLERMGEYEIVGLVDDNVKLVGQEVFGHRVLGDTRILGEVRAMGVEAGIVGIGDNKTRGALANRMLEYGLELISAIHPSACISGGVHIGPGSAMMANAVVNADSSLGANVIVNTAATVDHDNVVGDCVHLSPGVHLSGGVTIGAYSHLGTGVVVIPNIRIGDQVTVAAGSVVTKDLPDGIVAAGVPARAVPGKSGR
jgi:sugar O-acyltransferase (sialic acid O-acetyltransferase NeuD family)